MEVACVYSRLWPIKSSPPATPSIKKSPLNSSSLTVTNNPVDAVSALTTFSTNKLLPIRSTKSGIRDAV